ncbi:hypothetical protein [Thauera propionica]|uniref:hypothetical protein n=1 Tax=Thauera propionica TaxID=2019431 RepID=UPI001F0B1EB3|nr:hypothetical protein [Thauera propionica]
MDETFVIEVGDTLCIAPGTAHCVEAMGDAPLKLLCCCSPAYSHDDTEILTLHEQSSVSLSAGPEWRTEVADGSSV